MWFHFVVLAQVATGCDDSFPASAAAKTRVGDMLPKSISGASLDGCCVRNTDSSGKCRDMSVSAGNGKLLAEGPSENTN